MKGEARVKAGELHEIMLEAMRHLDYESKLKAWIHQDYKDFWENSE